MFSEELRELDRNTVQYMIDDMKDEIDAQKETIAEQGELLSQKDAKIDVQEKLLSQKDDKIDSQEKLLSQKDDRINAQNKEIEELKRRLAQFQTESM